METLKILTNTFIVINSPLDQFDNVSFNIFNILFENTHFYGNYIFEFDYDLISLFNNNYKMIVLSFQGELLLSIIFISFIFYY